LKESTFNQSSELQQEKDVLGMHDSHCRVNQMYYGSYLQFLPLRQCSHGSFINLNLMD
jgi:hypothetical protein